MIGTAALVVFELHLQRQDPTIFREMSSCERRTGSAMGNADCEEIAMSVSLEPAKRLRDGEGPSLALRFSSLVAGWSL